MADVPKVADAQSDSPTEGNFGPVLNKDVDPKAVNQKMDKPSNPAADAAIPPSPLESNTHPVSTEPVDQDTRRQEIKSLWLNQGYEHPNEKLQGEERTQVADWLKNNIDKFGGNEITAEQLKKAYGDGKWPDGKPMSEADAEAMKKVIGHYSEICHQHKDNWVFSDSVISKKDINDLAKVPKEDKKEKQEQ